MSIGNRFVDDRFALVEFRLFWSNSLSQNQLQYKLSSNMTSILVSQSLIAWEIRHKFWRFSPFKFQYFKKLTLSPSKAIFCRRCLKFEWWLTRFLCSRAENLRLSELFAYILYIIMNLVYAMYLKWTVWASWTRQSTKYRILLEFN